jgi:hypothetical protein
MGVRPGFHGRLRALQVAPWAGLTLSLLIMLAAAGCGTHGKRGSMSSNEPSPADDSHPSGTVEGSQSEVESGWKNVPNDDRASRPKTSTKRDGQPSGSSSTKSSDKKSSTHVASQSYTEPAGPGNHVRITQSGCVDFEPRWASVQMGQPIVWTSDLSKPVTIHVSSGAFGRTEYTVPAGATVSTGPARNTGSFSIWTDPASCQTVPRGVHGSGPGISITR